MGEHKLHPSAGQQKQNIKKVATWIISLCAIILLSAIVALELANAKHIILGTNINGINVGGMTKFQAQLNLEQAVREYEKQYFTLKFNDHEWRAHPQALGITFDIASTVEQAYAAGRRKDIFSGLKEHAESMLWGNRIDMNPSVNEAALEEFIASNMRMIETPTQDRTIYYSKETKSFWINPPSNGKIISRASLIQTLLEYARNDFSAGTVGVALRVDEPKITEMESRRALETADKIKNTPHALVFEEKKYPLVAEDILDMLEFNIAKENGHYALAPQFKMEKLKSIIAPLAPLINRKPQDAMLGADEDGGIIETTPGQSGIELNIEATAEAVQKNILASAETEVIIGETLPHISKEALAQAGIVDFLGKGESDFAGSPKNRVHNIKVGAAKFNNIFIEKDGEFSFVGVLGAVSAETGYKAELVIKKDRTIPEYGGGLCQVSTTMFRAAIYAGLKITERFPHAFPVKYYNPQGLDATIYPPHPDLRFLNNTPGKIFVQSHVEGTKITFSFFGKSDGRETKVDGPYTYDKQADGSLKAQFTQEVYNNGELVQKKTFWSSYRSPALYPVIRNPYE